MTTAERLVKVRAELETAKAKITQAKPKIIGALYRVANLASDVGVSDPVTGELLSVVVSRIFDAIAKLGDDDQDAAARCLAVATPYMDAAMIAREMTGDHPVLSEDVAHIFGCVLYAVSDCNPACGFTEARARALTARIMWLREQTPPACHGHLTEAAVAVDRAHMGARRRGQRLIEAAAELETAKSAYIIR